MTPHAQGTPSAAGTAVSGLWDSLRAPAPGPRPPHDAALEGLRGLCAFAVLYGHAFAPVPALDPRFAPPQVFWWFDIGSAAMLTFFVLSGYVIGLTTTGAATGSAVRSYLSRRAWRLVPVNVCAVLLSWWLLQTSPWRAVVGNLLFLQNWEAYPLLGEWPLLRNNYSLWSLNFEILYYLLFVLVWRFAPAVGTLAAVIVVLIAGALAGGPVPVIFGAYAVGACFWLAGLLVAWRTAPCDAAQPRASGWPAAVAGAYAMWMTNPFQAALRALELDAWVLPAIVPPVRLDFALTAVWLLLAVTGRAPKLQRLLTPVCLALATAAWIWRLRSDPVTGKEAMVGLALLAGWLARRRDFSLRPLEGVAALGTISFAVYAIGLPCQFGLRAFFPDASGTPFTFATRAVALFALVIGAAWMIERRLCPWLKNRFQRRVLAYPVPEAAR